MKILSVFNYIINYAQYYLIKDLSSSRNSMRHTGHDKTLLKEDLNVEKFD